MMWVCGRCGLLRRSVNRSSDLCKVVDVGDDLGSFECDLIASYTDRSASGTTHCGRQHLCQSWKRGSRGQEHSLVSAVRIHTEATLTRERTSTAGLRRLSMAIPGIGLQRNTHHRAWVARNYSLTRSISLAPSITVSGKRAIQERSAGLIAGQSNDKYAEDSVRRLCETSQIISSRSHSTNPLRLLKP